MAGAASHTRGNPGAPGSTREQPVMTLMLMICTAIAITSAIAIITTAATTKTCDIDP